MADVHFQSIQKGGPEVTVTLVFTGETTFCGVSVYCCDQNFLFLAGSNLTRSTAEISSSATGFGRTSAQTETLTFSKVPGVPDPPHYLAILTDGTSWLDFPIGV